MTDLNQKLLGEFLKSRHSGLINGALLLFAAGGLPLLMGYLSNTDIYRSISVALKWFGGGYSDCLLFDRQLMLLLLSIQVGMMLAVIGMATLFSYFYREYKFRSVIRTLTQWANGSTTEH